MAQRSSRVSEISSGDSEKLKQGNAKQMSDVATANFLVEQIGGKRHVGDMLHTAWRELSKRFPHREDPENKWTEKRLKSWRYNESNVVKHFQMVELFETAEALRAARNEHAEYIAKTARIRQMAKLIEANEAGGMAER
jgi:hypothetical protein